LADPDVWYKPACKENGFEYYEYILVYVDDILAISHKPSIIMQTIQKTVSTEGRTNGTQAVFRGCD
jgi:hypothetical protein